MTASVKIVGIHKRDEAPGRRSCAERPVRAAVVLAGDDCRRDRFGRGFHGEGPLSPSGALSGTQSRLAETFRRIDRLIPADRVVTAVSPGYFRCDDASRELGRRPNGTVVVQPQHKGSAPSLLFALTYLRRRHANALVAVFPANGEFRDDGLLMTRVDAALRYVERRPEVMVILGVEPARVECGFGYVVPDGSVAGADPPIVGVSRFIEQPSRRAAEDLIQQGALWSTSILVFRLGMLLDFVWRTAPLLPFAFTEIAEAIGSPEEYAVIEAVYDRLPPVDFARGVLELVADGWPSSLAVLRVDAKP